MAKSVSLKSTAGTHQAISKKSQFDPVALRIPALTKSAWLYGSSVLVSPPPSERMPWRYSYAAAGRTLTKGPGWPKVTQSGCKFRCVSWGSPDGLPRDYVRTTSEERHRRAGRDLRVG